VSDAGDVDGDGIDDLLIGAMYASPNGRDKAGESYVVFGRAALSGNGERLSRHDAELILRVHAQQ
jgi:hypothetical protein